jgi:hypothetical protein
MTLEKKQMSNDLHEDLYAAKELLYDKGGFHLTMLTKEKAGTEYGACTFKLNVLEIVFRIAKTTPTKNGLFVTIWKRNQDGKTEPFTLTDGIDFIIISCRSGIKLGQFIFPVSVLAEQKIVSDKNRQGKRGIRVYPPWDITTSKQAAKTQIWQTKYFIPVEKNNSNGLELVKTLLTKHL